MTPFIADLKRLALAATPGAGWTCWRCEQRNAGWTTTCGRCELDRITPERILAMIAVIDQMRDALLGVMGLVELIASRDDLPVGLDDLMRLSHRMTEAKAVLAALEGEQK